MNNNEPATAAASVEKRFDGNDWFYFGGLAALFLGVALRYSVADALIVLGAIAIAVSLINSYVMAALVIRNPKN